MEGLRYRFECNGYLVLPDVLAIEWGYKPIPGASTPAEEKPELDRIAARQVDNPMLRFGGEDPVSTPADPTTQSEDLGSDPVEATTYDSTSAR